MSGSVAGAGASLLPIYRNKLRHARLLHGHAIEDRSLLHGAPVVCDHAELGLCAHLAYHLSETPDVGLIKRRIDFIQNAERTWLVAEYGNQQGQRCESLFATGKQQNILQALPRRLRSDVDSRFAGTVGLGETHLSGAAPEEGLEGIREMCVDDGKCFFKFLAGYLVQFANGLLRIGDGLQQIGALALEEGEALLAL